MFSYFWFFSLFSFFLCVKNHTSCGRIKHRNLPVKSISTNLKSSKEAIEMEEIEAKSFMQQTSFPLFVFFFLCVENYTSCGRIKDRNLPIKPMSTNLKGQLRSHWNGGNRRQELHASSMSWKRSGISGVIATSCAKKQNTRLKFQLPAKSKGNYQLSFLYHVCHVNLLL